MEKEELHELINLYFENGLSPEKEQFLFASLSQNSDAIEYFKKMSLLKAGFAASKSEFPPLLDELITSKVAANSNVKTTNRRTGISNFIAYGAALIFLLASLLFYSLLNDYKTELTEVKETVKYQNSLMNSLLNTLPVVTVHEKLPNEITITKNL
jgi:hypothetical protein